MHMKSCIIFGNAEISNYSIIQPISAEDFVISADGGWRHLKRLGIKPHLFIGDMDSLQETIPEDIKKECYQPEKDDTDTLLALKEAMRRGYDDIMIIGGLGGRIDHTLANISLTAFAAQHGAVCHLIDEHHQIFAIHNDSIMVKKGYWKWLSVFAAGSEVRGVSLRGLKYPLQEAVLTNTYPIGVSNEFVSSSAVVTAAQGTLLIVLSDLD